MATDFDFGALAQGALDAACNGSITFRPKRVKVAADYLQEKIEPAFVPRTEVTQLREALSLIEGISAGSRTVNSLPHIQQIAKAALGDAQ